eukprot:Blabericola_migrator_1__8351@NODE_4341_length_1212_cov_19_606987_g2682_i0_p1_GENE_NODE_4341_length_1212_cov_19_606987_g2682_i0NODE_4341_length_1212_cov_19_606987_g2682_i0_p1_ORF_typecomplete_len144_score22_98Peptidase_M20/PF01546_28/0_04Nitrate_red_gam/PF02665_14/0_13_NODE_4341_length_1212_cov_19_606987_g2682_i07231154
MKTFLLLPALLALLGEAGTPHYKLPAGKTNPTLKADLSGVPSECQCSMCLTLPAGCDCDSCALIPDSTVPITPTTPPSSNKGALIGGAAAGAAVLMAASGLAARRLTNVPRPIDAAFEADEEVGAEETTRDAAARQESADFAG